MPKKVQGQWETKVLKELLTKTSAVWRAQASTSPSGEKFVSVRVFHKRKTGELLPGKANLTFLVGPETKEAIGKVQELLEVLSDAIASMPATKKVAAKKVATEKVSGNKWFVSDGECFLVSRTKMDNGKYSVKKQKETAGALSFLTKEKAEAFLERSRATGLHSRWEAVQGEV